MLPYYVLRILCTCRPSGALGYLVHVACYKHAAPLGLKQAPVPLLPDGLGNPTPTNPTARFPIISFFPLCVVMSSSLR